MIVELLFMRLLLLVPTPDELLVFAMFDTIDELTLPPLLLLLPLLPVVDLLDVTADLNLNTPDELLVVVVVVVGVVVVSLKLDLLLF